MDSQKEMSKVLRIAGGGSSIVIGPHNPAPAPGPAPPLPATAKMTQITESSVQPSPAQPSPAQHSHYAPGPGHFYNSNF